MLGTIPVAQARGAGSEGLGHGYGIGALLEQAGKLAEYSCHLFLCAAAVAIAAIVLDRFGHWMITIVTLKNDFAGR